MRLRDCGERLSCHLALMNFDDAGVECFLMLSSSLSEKINAKLTRQRLCAQIAALQGGISDS